MVNESGLKPLGRAVLVKPYEPEMVNSLIKIPDFVRQNSALADTRCIVIELGPHAWHDELSPRAVVGDIVLVTKFAGFMAVGTADGELYRLVNDRDIFCQIVKEQTKEERKVAHG